MTEDEIERIIERIHKLETKCTQLSARQEMLQYLVLMTLAILTGVNLL